MGVASKLPETSIWWLGRGSNYRTQLASRNFACFEFHHMWHDRHKTASSEETGPKSCEDSSSRLRIIPYERASVPKPLYEHAQCDESKYTAL